MEYVKGKPYFADSENKIKQYPYLNENQNCDILVIGGGIDGAILNYYLSQKYDVMLVDKGRFAKTCTSCATALCEYQLDDYAEDLKTYLTENEIALIYKKGLESIKKFSEFIKKYGNHCMFTQSPSFIYSDNKKGGKKIEIEYNFRKKYNFDCELFEETNNPFPFKITKGLFCKDGGCSFNPYLMAKQLIENSSNQNKIYENTDVSSINRRDDYYMVETNYGDKIRCNKIVLATGFNWEIIEKTDLCDRFVTYTIVTKPIPIIFYKNAMIEDDNEPYHYFRILPDNRIIFGGEDVKWNDKIEEDKSEKKYAKLENDLKELLPDYSDKIEIEYKFCGCFGSTNNNLGIISETEKKNIFYFFSCGANGIINANFGVELLIDIMNDKENPLKDMFSIYREIT